MNVLKNILLLFITVIAIFALVFGIIGYSSEVFVDEETYLDAFEEHNLYGFIESQPIIEGTTIEDLEGISVRGIVDDSVVSVLEYIRGDTDEVEVEVSLTSEELLLTLQDEVLDLPECSGDEDMAELFEAISQQDLGAINCVPGSYSEDELIELVKTEIPSDVMEEEITIDLLSELDVSEEDLDELRDMYTLFNTAWLSSLVLGVALLVLLGVVNLNEKSRGLGWIGGVLVGTGLVLVIVATFTTAALSDIVSQDELDEGPAMDILKDVLGEFVYLIGVYGGILLLIGVLAAIGGFVLWRSEMAKLYEERGEESEKVETPSDDEEERNS